MTIARTELRCAAILFDLDGVLIDSTACVERLWRAWAAGHGLDAEAILGLAHGVRNIDTMRRVASHLDVEAEAAEFAIREVADTRGITPVDGATNLLRALDGARWAVVTSGSAELARARMGAAGLPLPEVLITADDVARGKPGPEPYLVAAQRLGFDAADCIVIEDAPAGVRSGRGAQMRVIGVAATHRRAELLESGADFIFKRLGDILVLKPNDWPEHIVVVVP